MAARTRSRDDLEHAGVVTELAVPTEDRDDGAPDAFYTLTDDARTLFDENGLFSEAAWQREYDSVQKNSTIEALQTLPRPQL